jgi:hypothetical protein
VSKHTTCSDVDEGGVKRLVEVLVRRCRRCDVDVGAVLLGTNKAHAKTKIRTHTSNPKNLGQRGLTKVVTICVKIMSDFMSNGQMDVKRGIMMLKQG